MTYWQLWLHLVADSDIVVFICGVVSSRPPAASASWPCLCLGARFSAHAVRCVLVYFVLIYRFFSFAAFFSRSTFFSVLVQVGVEDITDVIEKFEDDVQSVDMTTMNRL